MNNEELLQLLVESIVTVLNESEHYNKTTGDLVDEICYREEYHHIRRSLDGLGISLKPHIEISIVQSMLRDEVFVYDDEDNLILVIPDQGLVNRPRSVVLDYIHKHHWAFIKRHYMHL